MIGTEVSYARYGQAEHKIEPTHKITISNGPTDYIFWYMQRSVTERPFDKIKDGELLDPMYTKGCALGIGQSAFFSTSRNRNYRLRRRSSLEFTVSSLR